MRLCPFKCAYWLFGYSLLWNAYLSLLIIFPWGCYLFHSKSSFCNRDNSPLSVICVLWPVSPSNSYVEILTLTVMVLGGGDFKRWLGHERGALVNGITALIKWDPSELSLPFCHVRTQWENGRVWMSKWTLTESAGNLLLDFSHSPELWEINADFFFKPRSLRYLCHTTLN